MSLTTEQPAPPVLQQEDPPCYEIWLRTWTTDRSVAFDLAVQISESLANNNQVDTTATTIGIEDEPAAERERVYAELVGPPPGVASGEPGTWSPSRDCAARGLH